MCMMSFYDLIQGESNVHASTASYWTVLFTLLSHLIIVYFEWPDWSN